MFIVVRFCGVGFRSGCGGYSRGSCSGWFVICERVVSSSVFICGWSGGVFDDFDVVSFSWCFI